MEYRTLGKTGLKVSILGFGGIPIRNVSEKEAIAVVNRALDLGVNFIHTSANYGDSAYKIGKVMLKRRSECFLTVKVSGRTETEAREQLKRSLTALNTNHIEIAQLPVNDYAFAQVMDLGGAYKAFQQAQREGIIDFIGITSHDVSFLTEAIASEAFSNLIVPFNYAANTPREKLLPLAAKLNMGVIAMKTQGKGGLTNASQALRYVWNHDVDTAIVGMSKLTELEENVATAHNPRPLTEDEKRELQRIADEIIRTNRLSSSGEATPPSPWIRSSV